LKTRELCKKGSLVFVCVLWERYDQKRFKKKFSFHLQTYPKSYIINLYAAWHTKKGKKREFKEEWLMVTAVVGANWGDEGKGKITDMLGEESDIIVRFQGGSNAGHTIVNDYGKFALHILPSGVFYNHTTSIIGNGVALNIPDLFREINDIVNRGVPKPKILVSDRAQIVMPYHVLFDQYEEERLAGKSFGSTKSGIAPFYSDKYAKVGVQVSELFDEEALREKIEGICVQKNVILEHLYHKPALNVDELMKTLAEYRDMVAPYVCDVSAYLYEARQQGKRILLEGQLGSLKDPDHGIYPMVTSSSTLAAYGAIGAGIPPYEIGRIVTVVKAYSSAVGAGEFVSEIFGDEADELRRRGGDGGEYGATTGRPRRMGWFDAVASRYGCRIQGATEVALTVLDVLGYLDELPICVGYEIDGKVTKDFPTTRELKKAKPVYEVLPGWKEEIRGITEYDKLPENCRKYIEFIEKELGVPIKMVSNGPGRHEIIYR
jgi:adenylosuccinate synthase